MSDQRGKQGGASDRGTQRTRVAVIGGGCAAMTAAYELSKPEHGGRYEVTVFQQGWRLGGKGASGRGLHGRIEEHGLHVWMGFYENAFRLMRDAYGQLDRDPATCPIATWRDAFIDAPHVGLANWTEQTDWTVWSAVFPPYPGLPGDPHDASMNNPFSVLGYMVRAAESTASLLRVAYGPPASAAPGHDRTSGEAFPYAGESPASLMRLASDLLKTAVGAAATLLGLVEQRVALAAALLRHAGTARVEDSAVAILANVLTLLSQLKLPDDATQPRVRAAEVVEVLVASQVGILREGLLTREEGFDAIDEHDFLDWLRLHGASEQAVCSPFIRGLYSLMFAYEDGDFRKPRVAAGQMLRGCVRMFYTYRGAFFWKMRAGMGDIVFTPLYEVMRDRGVRFEFFHRLTDVCVNPVVEREQYVTSLRFLVQARTREGAPYEPLVDYGGLPCWPSEPDWDQLEGGAKMRDDGRLFESFWDDGHVATKELMVEKDFDFVVLATGLGEIPHVCAQILDRDLRWQRMVRNLKTVATQALQVWSSHTLPELGWDRGSVTMTAFVSPFDTWADMTYLLDKEAWPPDHAPKSLAYFCNVLDDRMIEAAGPRDRGHQARTDEAVYQNAHTFVTRDLPKLWPGLRDQAGKMVWEALSHDGVQTGELGEARMRSQYYRSNVNPTDRYSLSLPGTPKYRISPLDRTYDNLSIAGDWTSCGFNLGCVEAAVMSGLLAAHALCGSPRLSDIVGYDHP